MDATLHNFHATDGYVWSYRQYEPPGEVRADIVALHGIQSHGGWYVESSKRLAAEGYRVSFLDRRGSGLNFRDRADTPSFRRLLDDAAEFIATRPRPRFLLGISWGGKLAACLPRRHPDLIDGLILLAPGISSRVGTKPAVALRILASRFAAPTRRFPIPLDDPALFTANPARREFIRDDPLALHDATARLMFEAARMSVFVRFAPRHVRVPTFLALAERDRIVNNRAARAFVNRFAADDRTVVEYAGAQHTLEFEPNGPPFLDDLTDWLDARTPAYERSILPFRKQA